MAIKPSIYNAMDGPVPIIYTAQGPFIICMETITAYNVTQIEVDFNGYVETYPVLCETMWHRAVEAFMLGQHVPCGTFTPIKTGKYTWYRDSKSGLTVPPGARNLFKSYSYSYYGSTFLIHTTGGTLVAIIIGNLEVLSNGNN